MTQTYLKLNNGLEMPQFGLGVFLIPDGKETINACLNAFNLGIRHIDTAHAYQNERGVGGIAGAYECSESRGIKYDGNCYQRQSLCRGIG